MNKFDSIKFKTSSMKAHGSQVLKGLAVGKFTREAIKKYAQTLSHKLHKEGKNARVGVALHYKKSNAWASAEYTDAGCC